MKLIDLQHFRRINRMRQEDLAKILRVSRAYIAQVENGSNNLSDQKIDELLDFSEQWDTEGLVPCFDRLLMLAKSLYEKDHDNFCKKVTSDSYDVRWSLKPLLGVLPESTILLIRHGRSAITESIADTIVAAFPQVNKTWLTTGQGDMYVDSTKKDVELTKETLVSFEKNVYEELAYIKNEVGEIKEMLKSILEKIEQ